MKRLGETAAAGVVPGKRLPDLVPFRDLIGKDFAITEPPDERPSGKRAGDTYLVISVWLAGHVARYQCDSHAIAEQLRAIQPDEYPVWCSLVIHTTARGNQAYRLIDARGEPPAAIPDHTLPTTREQMWTWIAAQGIDPGDVAERKAQYTRDDVTDWAALAFDLLGRKAVPVTAP